MSSTSYGGSARYLEPLVAEFEQAAGCQFEILQVKEKFGELRIQVNHHANEAIRERIGVAEEEAYRTCEVRGQPGRLREDDSDQDSCDECQFANYSRISSG